MDRTRVEQLLTQAVDEQVQGLRDWRDALGALTTRVGALEGAITELRESLPDAISAQLRDAVSGELATVALILRRQIDDVTRMLRDAVAEVAPGPDAQVIDLTAGR
jgi:hypothetical protein